MPLPPVPLPREHRLYVGGISIRTTKEELIEFFSQFGNLLHCKAKKNSKTGKLLGHAILTFEDPKVVQKLAGTQIMIKERVCECREVLKNDALKEAIIKNKNRNLQVYDIDKNVSNQEFIEAFKHFSGFSHAYLLKNPTVSGPKQNKGSGFVVFKSEEDLLSFIKQSPKIKFNRKTVKYSQKEGTFMQGPVKNLKGGSSEKPKSKDKLIGPKLDQKSVEPKPKLLTKKGNNFDIKPTNTFEKNQDYKNPTSNSMEEIGYGTVNKLKVFNISEIMKDQTRILPENNLEHSFPQRQGHSNSQISDPSTQMRYQEAKAYDESKIGSNLDSSYVPPSFLKEENFNPEISSGKELKRPHNQRKKKDHILNISRYFDDRPENYRLNPLPRTNFHSLIPAFFSYRSFAGPRNLTSQFEGSAPGSQGPEFRAGVGFPWQQTPGIISRISEIPENLENPITWQGSLTNHGTDPFNHLEESPNSFDPQG